MILSLKNLLQEVLVTFLICSGNEFI